VRNVSTCFSVVATEGLIIHDNGIVLEINSAFSRLSGYSREEMLGENFLYKNVHPDERNNVLDKIKSHYDKPYESRIIKKDGNVIPIEFHGYSTQFGDKTVRVVSVRDLNLQNF
jgi:PAS domain S-box-containing protein